MLDLYLKILLASYNPGFPGKTSIAARRVLTLGGDLPGTERGKPRAHFRQSLESAYAQIALSDEYDYVGLGGTRSKTPQAVVESGCVQQAAEELGEIGSDIVEHYWNSVDQAGSPDL